VRDKREVIREETFMQKKILELLKKGPKTIPEIARALNKPPAEIMYWMMSMRKYQLVEETGEASEKGYYKYGLKEVRK
jgi:predicted transcriptional regulator